MPEFPLAFTITYHDLQQFNISQTYNVNGQRSRFWEKIFRPSFWWCRAFPEQAFNLRMGYNVKRGNELAVLRPKKFCRIKFQFWHQNIIFRFDYSHVRYHNTSNVNQIGLMEIW